MLCQLVCLDRRYQRMNCFNIREVQALLKGRFFVPQGTPLPLKGEEMYQTIPDNSMFMFAKNIASPYCKSTYSTFGGQLCLSKNQMDYVAQRRAGNNDFPGDGVGF